MALGQSVLQGPFEERQERALRYEDVKRKLASRHSNDREAYTESKSEYIERATKEAKARLKGHN
jgi:GrpB-like predicted nucleotidyltransferase (UPF0157 family)